MQPSRKPPCPAVHIWPCSPELVVGTYIVIFIIMMIEVIYFASPFNIIRTRIELQYLIIGERRERRPMI
jgi:hypothetical protein